MPSPQDYDAYVRCTAENYDPDPARQQLVQVRCYTEHIAKGGQVGDDIYGQLDSMLGGILPGGTPFQNPFSPQTYGPGTGVAGAAVLNGDVQIIAAPQTVSVQKAPPGYVIVSKANGQKVAMLKEVAYALGLRKRPHKRGGISGKDIQTARRVQGVIMSLSVKRAPRVPIKGGKRKSA